MNRENSRQRAPEIKTLGMAPDQTWMTAPGGKYIYQRSAELDMPFIICAAGDLNLYERFGLMRRK
ncbi:MAG: hypothetical protein LBK41_02455 [Clostridiales bacterium]|jgi:hypothetical protein|nr:hypothetical protein [Clostridiales bacterium]